MKRTYTKLSISASVIGVLLSLSSGRPLAGEPASSSLTMGPKTIMSHQAKAVVGPSVQVDEQGRAHLAWTEEDREVRSLWHAKSDGPGRFCFFEPGMDQRMQARRLLAEHRIERDQLEDIDRLKTELLDLGTHQPKPRFGALSFGE